MSKGESGSILSGALIADLLEAMRVDALPHPFATELGTALDFYVKSRLDEVRFHSDRLAVADFVADAKKLQRTLSRTAKSLDQLHRAKPNLFCALLQSVEHAIEALKPNDRVLVDDLLGGCVPRGNRNVSRQLLREDVLIAVLRLDAVKFNLERSTARRGAPGLILKAVMREADRLDGLAPTERNAEIKLKDWNRWVDQAAGRLFDMIG